VRAKHGAGWFHWCPQVEPETANAGFELVCAKRQLHAGVRLTPERRRHGMVVSILKELPS
jgi:hypothetical protein